MSAQWILLLLTGIEICCYMVDKLVYITKDSIVHRDSTVYVPVEVYKDYSRLTDTQTRISMHVLRQQNGVRQTRDTSVAADSHPDSKQDAKCLVP